MHCRRPHCAARNQGIAFRASSFVILYLLAALSGARLLAADLQLSITRVTSYDDGGRLRVVVAPRGESGHLLRDLAPGHFTVLVDARPVSVVRLDPTASDDQPLAVVLLLDVSGSMAQGNALGAASNAALNLIGSLAPQDQACLVTFGDSVRLVTACTANKDSVRRSVVGIFPTDQKTLLYDGLLRALAVAGAAPTKRCAVVVFTKNAV